MLSLGLAFYIIALVIVVFGVVPNCRPYLGWPILAEILLLGFKVFGPPLSLH